jgi:pimeloyl-ACP methyl ester carboxylesterase
MSFNMTRSQALGQSATPLVLLCGLLCDSTIWSAAARYLNSKPQQIESLPPSDSIGAMARGVLQRAPEKFALGGHSMGGRVALEVVRQAPEIPHARLAVIEAAGHMMPIEQPGARAREINVWMEGLPA